MNGFGYPQSSISVPENGLYYMWIYFSGNGLKNVYGYILVDNLEPDIALEGISLPSTKTLKLGETLTLTPTFKPTNATNKIVNWTSSDESIVAVDNAGEITGKKVGSAIITVTTQDGNKKATCTVTVIANEGVDNGYNKENTGNIGNTTEDKNNNTNNPNEDNTKATGKLPQTGMGIGIVIMIVVVTLFGVYFYNKQNKLKDI